MIRKLLLVILYFYALLFSVLKTIRFPNDWSESHWMLDYRFGFIKRGLGGEVFGWFFEKNQNTIFMLSAGVLLLLYVLLFAIAIKETFKKINDFHRILFFLIFFLSQYIVFSAHIIGYLDHVVFLLTILVIYLVKKEKVLLPSLIAAVSIFIHEISFFLMLPISCFALIIIEIPIEKFSLKAIFSKGIINKLILFLAFPFIAILSILIFQVKNEEIYFSKIFNYLSRTCIISEGSADSVASAYTKSFTYYFSEERKYFIQRLFISMGTIFYGIPILFSLWMIFKGFKLKKNLQLFFLLTIVASIPLLLHAIAFDTYRIWALPFMVIFLIFWILCSKFQVENEKIEKLTSIEIVFYIISFCMVSIIPNHLFDNEVERISIAVRLIMILPIFLILFFIKKLNTSN